MGYTSGTGSKGTDTYNATPQTVSDLQRLNDKLAERGNLLTGTTTVRTALTGTALYEGLHFYDTTLDTLFWYDGTGWVEGATPTIVPITTFGSNWSATPGGSGGYAPHLRVLGKRRELVGAATRGAGGGVDAYMTIPVGHRPAVNVYLQSATHSGGSPFQPYVVPDGTVSIAYGSATTAGVYPTQGSWYVP